NLLPTHAPTLAREAKGLHLGTSPHELRSPRSMKMGLVSCVNRPAWIQVVFPLGALSPRTSLTGMPVLHHTLRHAARRKERRGTRGVDYPSAGHSPLPAGSNHKPSTPGGTLRSCKFSTNIVPASTFTRRALSPASGIARAPAKRPKKPAALAP